MKIYTKYGLEFGGGRVDTSGASLELDFFVFVFLLKAIFLLLPEMA